MADNDRNVMTDVRELVDDFRELIEAAMDARQARIYTAMPVRVKKFDKDKLVAEVHPQIKTTIRQSDGSIKKTSFPEIRDVPVHFPSGGYEKDSGQGASSEGQKAGYMLTFPLKDGDEGIGLVSCRTIDHWHDQGDEQQQGSARMHDPSDMMFIPGIRSRPRAEDVKGGVDDSMAQLRSTNGSHYYGMNEDKEEGGLRGKTEAHIKNEASKNIEDTAGEKRVLLAKNIDHTAVRVASAQAGKAIVKTAAKIFLNSA
jgi:Phage protein Gp138 N-terminal domain